MAGRRALFSDLDGTLCFHEEAHGIRAVARDHDGAVIIEEPVTGRRYRAHDVSTSGYRIWVAEETLRLLRALAERWEVVLVTGGRPSTFERRRALFGFVHGVILENGGVILGPDLRPHAGWQARLEPERRLLPEAAARLECAGWRIDADGRTSALRVRLRDNPGRTAGELAALRRTLELPPGLRTTVNLENLDVILASAGKENAARFWMAERRLDPARAVGVGDDVNDVELLAVMGEAHVLASAYPAALGEARRRSWRITRAGLITGVDGLLAELLAGG